MFNSTIRDKRQLGNAIRAERKKHHLVQSELGEMTRSRQATISILESGEGSVRLDTLFRILAVLHLELVMRPRTKKDLSIYEEMQ